VFPALPESSIAERHQSSHSNKASITMLLVGLSLNESAHTGIFAVYEVHEIFAHAMQARWEAMVLDSIQISIGMAFLPGDGVPWSNQYNATTSYTVTIGALDSPHLLIEDHLEESSYRRRVGLGHCDSRKLAICARKR
jgi:hypothetical protein